MSLRVSWSVKFLNLILLQCMSHLFKTILDRQKRSMTTIFPLSLRATEPVIFLFFLLVFFSTWSVLPYFLKDEVRPLSNSSVVYYLMCRYDANCVGRTTLRWVTRINQRIQTYIGLWVSCIIWHGWHSRL